MQNILKKTNSKHKHKHKKKIIKSGNKREDVLMQLFSDSRIPPGLNLIPWTREIQGRQAGPLLPKKIHSFLKLYKNYDFYI